MRLKVVDLGAGPSLALALGLAMGAGVAAAQTPQAPGAAASPVPPLSPLPPTRTTDARPDTLEEKVADCIRLWDAGTHMTKREWAVVCRRVQLRLQEVKPGAMAPIPRHKRAAR
jgi:hypothetical protein